jgi:hypothetical protein
MSSMLTDADWDDLIALIKEGKCTPFIGAGACAGVLPLGRQVAEQWSTKYNYPLYDKTDLPRVAQYLSIARYEMFPKDEIRRQFQTVAPPDFAAPDEPHALLADLNLPIYITTNYDHFMVKALESRKRTPVQEFCRWNDFAEVKGMKSAFRAGYTPTPANPLVYHLHGHVGVPQSMVLTEGDYLDFLIRLSSDPKLLPAPVREALAGSALIFVGYSLTDWNFRVIFRGLVGSLGASLGYQSVAVQLPPSDMDDASRQKAQDYLNNYFEQIQKIKVQVFWGNARNFATELRTRMGKTPDG